MSSSSIWRLLGESRHLTHQVNKKQGRRAVILRVPVYSLADNSRYTGARLRALRKLRGVGPVRALAPRKEF